MKISICLVNLLLKVISRFPLPWIYRIGKGLGWFLYAVIRFRRRIVEHQIKRVFMDRQIKTREECRQMVRDFYSHFGLTIMETCKMFSSSYDFLDSWVVVEGESYLKEALQQQKGVLILGAHIGNWELSGAVMVRRGLTIATITKVVKGAVGRWIQEKLREKTGILSYPKKDSIRAIFQGLKANQVIVLMIDQNMIRDEGIFVNFLGYPACTLTSMVTLAQRLGTPIVPAAIYRKERPYVHQLVIYPPIVWEDKENEDRQSFIYRVTQILSQQVEMMIMRAPEQWLWVHKRWRTRPQEEEMNPFNYSRCEPL